jgi:hypothetical protein
MGTLPINKIQNACQKSSNQSKIVCPQTTSTNSHHCTKGKILFIFRKNITVNNNGSFAIKSQDDKSYELVLTEDAVAKNGSSIRFKI